MSEDVLRVGCLPRSAIDTLLARHGLRFEPVADGLPIPGSYWGECEAGIIGNTVHARPDTPVHSLLHEAN